MPRLIGAHATSPMAILGSVETPFSPKDGSRLDGQLSRTGVFLYESGAFGTIHQVDLTV